MRQFGWRLVFARVLARVFVLAPVFVLVMVPLCAVGARAQSGSATGPVTGSHEFQVWAGGGHSVPGGTKDTSVVNAGARYGWVLTNLAGPGSLRGRFEYAVNFIPVFVVSGATRTAYGISFDPVVLRWNFQQRRRIMPYAELSGGALFTNHAVPPPGGAVNFTPSFAMGISVPHGKLRWSAELHYLHISDSGLTMLNPGINTLQVRIGLGRFNHEE